MIYSWFASIEIDIWLGCLIRWSRSDKSKWKFAMADCLRDGKKVNATEFVISFCDVIFFRIFRIWWFLRLFRKWFIIFANVSCGKNYKYPYVIYHMVFIFNYHYVFISFHCIAELFDVGDAFVFHFSISIYSRKLNMYCVTFFDKRLYSNK